MNRKFFEMGFNRNQGSIKRVSLDKNSHIPTWLSGSFIRNGPGMFYIGEQRLNHWFDGVAMLHKFDFHQGEVNYQSKILDCRSSREALSQKELTYAEFATDPCWGIFGRLRSIFQHGPTDSAKVNLAKVKNQYFALGETTMQIEFDINTLNTIDTYNFNQPTFGTSSTAHPHLVEGEAYNLITKYGPINYYKILKMNRNATEITSVKTLTPAYMHSFGMSEKYFVIIESPYSVLAMNLMTINRPFIENFKWHPKRGSRILVIDQETSKVVFKKVVDSFFFFHFINTFETDQGITFDLVTYANADIIQSYYLDNINDPNTPIPGGTLKRFECNFSDNTITRTQLSDVLMELPSMDYARFNMNSNYQYVYAMSLRDDTSSFYDQIVKINLANGQASFWKQDGCYPGEPVFVSAPDSLKEDDGILLSIVLDTENESSFLLILDAHTLQEIARMSTPDPIMLGFHGQYFKN